jgi:hypothetical protein
MIGVDRLFDITIYLDRQSSKRSQILHDLRAFLNAVYVSDEYQKWLKNAQFFGSRSVEGKPREPVEAGGIIPKLKHLLTEYGLVANGRMNIKVDRHFDRIHITDGFWVEPTRRVFPTCDESEIVCKHIKSNIKLNGPGYLIDPACGSGHHALALRELFDRRVSLDISGRALAFCRFNSVLHGDVKHAVGFGDVRDGIPLEYTAPHGSHVVFAVNMPFAIDPKDHLSERSYRLAQDGGDRGIELTIASLRAIKNFAKQNSSVAATDAVILTYSLGYFNKTNSIWDWELDMKAKALLKDWNTKFHLLETENLWRVNGKKEQKNPMPVEKLELKADCIFTYSDLERDAKRLGFRNQANLFKGSGFTHLGYGLLHIARK